MTGSSHRLFGMAFGTAMLPFALHSDVGVVGGGLMMWGAWHGSTAPDWLELRRKKKVGYGRSLIKHRTLTHVLMLWLLLLFYGVWLTGHTSLWWVGAGVFGFAVGGVSHWVGDVGTPLGVPIINPRKRWSSQQWSAKTELVPVVIAWLIAGIMLTLGMKTNIAQLFA